MSSSGNSRNSETFGNWQTASGYSELIQSQLHYDGPSVFLQGQNGLRMTVSGMVLLHYNVTNINILVSVVANFNSYGGAIYNTMTRSGDVRIYPHSYCVDPVETVYTFEASFLSNFDSVYSGDIELNAYFAVNGSISFPADSFGPILLRSAAVISHDDQYNNRQREVSREYGRPSNRGSDLYPMPPAMLRSQRPGDQGPGLYIRPADQVDLNSYEPAIPEIGDQGPGEYVGPAENAEWAQRPDYASSHGSPAPGPSRNLSGSIDPFGPIETLGFTPSIMVIRDQSSTDSDSDN